MNSKELKSYHLLENESDSELEIGPFVKAEVSAHDARAVVDVNYTSDLWGQEVNRDIVADLECDDFRWDEFNAPKPKLDFCQQVYDRGSIVQELEEDRVSTNDDTTNNVDMQQKKADFRDRHKVESDRDNGQYREYTQVGMDSGLLNGSAGQTLDDSWHCHPERPVKVDKVARNQLIAICIICVIFMIGEIIGGVFSHSIALFTDVAHLASDLISFLISLLAIFLSTKPASKRMSLGYYRFEVLGALFSIIMIWLVTGVLFYTAVKRIITKDYTSVEPDYMLVTAVSGVVFNMIMGVVLISKRCGSASSHVRFGHSHAHGHSHSHGHSNNSFSINNCDREDVAYQPLPECASEEDAMLPPDNTDKVSHHTHQNINIRAAFIHVIGDIIQSIGVVIAALIIKFTDDDAYKLADPICTFVFSILVIFTTVNVFRDTLSVLLEALPRDIKFHEVLADIKEVPGVRSAHSLAVWTLTIDKNAIAVHISVDNFREHQKVLEDTSKMLRSKYKFIYAAIQVETHNSTLTDSCKDCIIPSL